MRCRIHKRCRRCRSKLVIFDATEHAYAANASLVLADTAGTIAHEVKNLMHELEKIVRVAGKGKEQLQKSY